MGKALNEGYTTLLEKRYFDSIDHIQKRGYVIEEFISDRRFLVTYSKALLCNGDAL